MAWRKWNDTQARVGVKTSRGDHARTLAAAVAARLQTAGVHEMRAGDWLKVPCFLPAPRVVPRRQRDREDADLTCRACIKAAVLNQGSRCQRHGGAR
jgi:hypothetical protein